MTKYAINIAWKDTEIIKSDDIVKYYSNKIIEAKKMNTKLIRIILCSWNINPVFDLSQINTLKKVINLAQKNHIDITLVLFNFADFNKFTYLDTGDKKYSWYSNPLNNIYKNPREFFNTIDKNILFNIEKIIFEIQKYNNVKFIELMNEIDQVQINNKILIHWADKILNILKNKFPKYNYSISISNYCYYNLFNKKLDCYVDLHSYSFPTSSAFNNLYLFHKKEKNILYMGEYSKNSDYPYIEQYESMIYFASSIWGARILNLEYTPMSWWWSDILKNDRYLTIEKIFESINQKYEFKIIRFIEVDKKDYIIYNQKSNQNESKKIKERIFNLIKHPFFIKHEIKNIKKYLIRKKLNNNEVFFYEINNGKYFYLETNNKIFINLTRLLKYGKYEILNLITNESNLVSKEQMEIYGCYLIKKL